MAANDPRPIVSATKPPQAGLPSSPVIKRPPLSAEDAELFASRIRPSWELIDDSARADVAADLGVVAEPVAKPKPAEPVIAKPVEPVVAKPAEPKPAEP